MNIKKLFKKIIPKHFHALLKSLLNLNVFYSYSQFGEDAYVYSYFLGKGWRRDAPMFLPRDGFYVDIGAYSPTECSNTHAFYKHGWHGINIDATPGVMSAFNVFNTADPDLAKKREIELGVKPRIVRVPCTTLENVLDQYMDGSENIDILSVDVEGFDLEVLKSNNWDRYRPEIIIAETYEKSIAELTEADIYKYMLIKEYELIAWLCPSLIFRDARSKS